MHFALRLKNGSSKVGKEIQGFVERPGANCNLGEKMQFHVHIIHGVIPMTEIQTTTIQDMFRILLGAFMVYAAIGHFTFLRKQFQGQVPDWVPLKKDTVVILSGVAELILGLAMIFASPYKVWVGISLAIFYILIFPGNIAQYKSRSNAFGLKTDRSRLFRLFFQPVLILWALWSTGALEYLQK